MFGSTRTIVLFCTLAVTLALGVASAPLASATPANLSGESFANADSGSLVCSPRDVAQPATMTFSASGNATGTFPGPYNESGTIALGPEVQSDQIGPYRPVLSFSATFTVTSGDTTISGTKTLHGAPLNPNGLGFAFNLGRCEDTVFFGASDYAQVLVDYQATIAQSSSSSCDSGTGEVVLSRQEHPFGPDSSPVFNFNESFTSTSSQECAIVPETTMGPQAMEGDLKVAPGSTLQAGYDFTMPGAHPAATVTFVNARVVFQATCVSGSGGAMLTVPIADQSYQDPANNSAWFPSGDQSNAVTYQGSLTVPDVCNGGLVRLQHGGTFITGVVSTDKTDKVNVRWHYRDGHDAGGWSGTRSIIPS
jgi:hypothetical protein